VQKKMGQPEKVVGGLSSRWGRQWSYMSKATVAAEYFAQMKTA
jgi:hypothetical protein